MLVAENPGEGHAIGELPRRAEQNDLLVFGGWVPVLVQAGTQGDPWQPAGEQIAGFHAHARWLHLDFGNGAEADEVFQQAGEGGDIGHAADGGATRTRAQPGELVARVVTGSGGPAGCRGSIRDRHR
ncbi:hypothetical protein D3C81_1915100 [compost metagenome]